MIGSLLRLQARTIDDEAITAKLEAMLERIDALATVHRRLYESDDVMLFDVGAFTENLMSDVIGASGRTEIVVESDIDRIDVPSAQATALGLVLNEVLTNAIKHAYADGRQGVLRASVKQRGDAAEIIISDDGPGLPLGSPGTGGLGATFIRRLSKQIGASVAWHGARSGTSVTITFPIGTK